MDTSLSWVFLFSTSLLISLLSIPIVIYAANKMHILDHPLIKRGEIEKRTIHISPVPRLGGLGMALGFFISILFWIDLPPSFRIVYLGSVGIMTLGIIDDFVTLSAKIRLIVQILICSLVVVYTNLYLEKILLLGMTLEIGSFLGSLLSIFILIGAINSLNMIDGMDGLAAGIVFVGISMLCYLHFLNTKETWSILFVGLGIIGSILGFLKYNTHPARIFMGDGGSNWLGYFCGFMLIIVFGGFSLDDQSGFIFGTQPLVSISSGILCMAIPILDTAIVIAQRILKKESPFKADKNHLHHTLHKLGMGQRKTVMTIYMFALILGTIAIFPISYPRYNLEWMPPIVLLTAMCLQLLVKFPTRKLEIQNQAFLKFMRIRRLPRSKLLIRTWFTINKYMVYGLVAVVPILNGEYSSLIGKSAFFMGSLLLLSLLFPTRKEDFSQALLIVLGLCIILIAVNQSPLRISINSVVYQVQYLYNLTFIILGISVFLFFLISIRLNSIATNTTDFLLLTLPLILLIVPEPFQSEFHFSTISARAFVIFFAIRTFVFGHRNIIRRLKILSASSLFFIAANALVAFKFIH